MSFVYMTFMATILYFSVRTIFLVFSHCTFENLFYRKKYVNVLHGTNEISSDGVCMSSIISSVDVVDDEHQSASDDHDDEACDKVYDTNWAEPEYSETSLSDEEIFESSSSESGEPESSETDEPSSPETELSETQLCDITSVEDISEIGTPFESGISTDLTQHNTCSVYSA
jgi:hypothetical protein